MTARRALLHEEPGLITRDVPGSELEPVLNGVLTEPDVWWGEHGTDALTWADPVSYEIPETETQSNDYLMWLGRS